MLVAIPYAKLCAPVCIPRIPAECLEKRENKLQAGVGFGQVLAVRAVDQRDDLFNVFLSIFQTVLTARLTRWSFKSELPRKLPFRACLESLRARPACIFSAIFREFALQYDSMAAANSLHLAKNLTAQYAHAEILNRLLKNILHHYTFCENIK